MTRIGIVLTLSVGFALGWFVRPWMDTGLNSPPVDNVALESAVRRESPTVPSKLSPSQASTEVLSSAEEGKISERQYLSDDTVDEIDSVSIDDSRSARAILDEYLQAREYVDAVYFYQDTVSNDTDRVGELKPILLAHLNYLLDQERTNDFTELTNAYLTSYYEDLDVLLLLAEFNRQTEYYVEAVGVFQLAKEYAYSIKDNEKVSEAFITFIDKIDTYLGGREDWYTLGQVFLQADIVGLLSPKQRFRQAQIFVENGDVYHGKQILNELLSDSRIRGSAQELLAQINDEPSTVQNPEPSNQGFRSAVALNQQGNQYLIDVSLGERTSNTLLIDTGASMTTLTRSAFENVRRSIRFSDVGARMFSTANGVTKGNVYRVDSFIIGDFEINDTLIAVLDFDFNSDVQGLLGMNVLGNFKFQIDQDRSELLLEPRR